MVKIVWLFVILPVQVTPSPVKPVLQVQVKEASVFVQRALLSQLCELSVHSSTSAYSKHCHINAYFYT